MKKKIALAIVPLFALAACSNDNSQDMSSGVAPVSQSVSQDENGFYQDKLLDSYNQAKDNGYTGTLDDWVALTKLSETDLDAAEQQAQDAGFSGGSMLLAGLAGAAVGALAAGAMSSRTGLANDAYSSQRVNNTTNYAYSQPYKQDECKDGGPNAKPDSNCRKGSGGGSTRTSSNTYVPVHNNTTNAALASTQRNANVSTNFRPSTPSVRSAPAPTRAVTVVSRGGFGGAVSSGG